MNVYELDTENCYKKKLSEINKDIPLAGLVPASQKRFSYTQQNIVLHYETFSIEEITHQERGVFIVEFIGGGLRSRALIKKGSLSTIRFVRRTGFEFYILDQNKNIRKPLSKDGYKLGIDFKKKWYPADSEGKIFIPYPQNGKQTGTAILIDGNFAELAEIELLAEVPKVNMSCIFNFDDLRPGKNIEMALNVKLLLANSKVFSNKHIKDKKVQVSSTSSAGVLNMVSYDNIEYSDGKDVLIDYLIPTKTVSLKISFLGKYFSQDKQEDIEINEWKEFTIDRHEKLETFHNFKHEIQAGGNHLIRVFGKNGEPLINTELKFTFTNTETSAGYFTDLKTDNNGAVFLGNLKKLKVRDFTVTLKNSASFIEKFNVFSHNNISNLPKTFTIESNENLVLPLLEKTLDRKNYTLVRTNSAFTIVYKDFFGNLEIENDILLLKNLPVGYYSFTYMNHDNPHDRSNSWNDIHIKVLKGERFELDPTCLITENSIHHLLPSSTFLTHTTVKLEEPRFKENYSTGYKKKVLKMKILSNNISSLKVHIIQPKFSLSN